MSVTTKTIRSPETLRQRVGSLEKAIVDLTIHQTELYDAIDGLTKDLTHVFGESVFIEKLLRLPSFVKARGLLR